MDDARSNLLFEEGIPSREWAEFDADGYATRVAGCLMSSADPPCCGVPMGGIGTGSIDIEATGALGFVTVFPTRQRHPDTRYQTTYREPASQLPFLGLAVDGQTWMLAIDRQVNGGRLTGCVEPGMNRELADDPSWQEAWSTETPAIQGVQAAESIDYWGHYPIADLRYRTGAPVSAATRAWSPFVLGDAEVSNTPAAVFEVHLRNAGDTPVSATLAISFPGPIAETVGPRTYDRSVCSGTFQGITVASSDGDLGFALGAFGETVRVGSGLHHDPHAWSRIADELPDEGRAIPGELASASAAVDIALSPGEHRVVRFLLSWYAPRWTGGSHTEILGFEQWPIGPYPPPGRDTEAGHTYTTMYATRFSDAEHVAHWMADHHESLLRRIIAWQEAIYQDSTLEPWLKDALVNSLSVITEDAYWSAPDKALGAWTERNGALGLVESPRGCAITGCIVSNWYGDLPLLYFFPELERTILANYAALLRPDGAVPFLFPNGDFSKPTYEWLLPLNGVCFVGVVDRLWRRTGDLTVLDEFYPAVKANTIFQMNLVEPPRGVVSVHRVGTGQEWWEHTPVQGMVTHAAGLRLATLQIVARMAEAAGDLEFRDQCTAWFQDGAELVESELWSDEIDSYVFFSDPDNAAESRDILSSQLDGEWASMSHGFGGVFRDDRVKRVLDTIERTCLGPYAVAGFTTSDGAKDTADAVTFSRDGVPIDVPYGTFTAESDIIGMTFLYHGRRDVGLEIVRRTADNIIRAQGHGWDLPNMVRSDTGERNFGTDYFQKLTIWGVPAALSRQSLEGPCETGGLVHRMLKAASEG